MRPWMVYSLAVVAPLLCLGMTVAGGYLAFRDEMLASILTRQSEMQYAYEDRLASLRVQLDRVTSRQLIDQDSLEGRVHELISRQAQIETRASVLSMLADQAGVGKSEATSSIAKSGQPTRAVSGRVQNNPLLAQPGLAPLPPGVSTFAPIGPAPARPGPAEKPRPEPL